MDKQLKRELIEQAEAEFDRLKAQGWTRADFAAALAGELQAGWNLSCEKCGATVGEPCGWPTNCPTGKGAAAADQAFILRCKELGIDVLTRRGVNHD